MQPSGRDKAAPEAASTSLGRGLAILRALNTGAYLTLHGLHEATGIPKPSIVRLLRRFIIDGYVAKAGLPGYYRLAAGISALSAGLNPAWAAVDAVERTPALLADYKWPVAIGTRADASLLVLFSTRRPGDPYSFKPSTFGTRLPLLTTAMGAAFLASCADDELLRAVSDVAETGAVEAAKTIDGIVKATRTRGYGLRLGGKGESTSVAVPIRGTGERLVGVIAQSGFAAAVSTDDIRSFARDLTITAALIERDIRLS